MGSPAARLSTLVLVAIVAPVTIVVGLGYVSLRQWEASSDLLVRADRPAWILTVHGQGYKFATV